MLSILVLSTAESCHVMPDSFEGLLVVLAGAGYVAEDAGIEPAVAGERHAEVHELLAPVAGVAAQLGRGQAEAAVPFDREGQASGRRLCLGAEVAGFEDQGFGVA